MPYRLLLADDSVTIQRVIELTFADEDVKVTAVGDGQQAVERIAADRPDIVLADVGMPHRDGYEVASFVKNTPDLAHIPVLLLTGAFEPVDEERARAARCNGVLAKPFEPQLLIARVKELLSGVQPSPGPVVLPPEPAGAPTLERAGVVPVGPEARATEPPAVSRRTPPDTASPSAGTQVSGIVQTPEMTAADDVAPEPARPTPQGSRPSEQNPLGDEDTISLAPPIGAGEEEMDLDAAMLSFHPETPAEPDNSLDDYFDRLDAAFANLAGQPVGAGSIPRRPTVPDAWEPEAGLPPTDGWTPTHDEAAERAAEARQVARAVFSADRRPPERDDSPGGYGGLAPGGDTPVAVPVAEAFASLLQVEQDLGPAASGHADVGAGASLVLPGTAVTEAFLDQVTRRVVERLGDQALREMVREVVSATAERLVRAEIERLKASIR